MNFDLDNADKQLLADKLKQTFTTNKFLKPNKFFEQLQIILEQFDININYINNNKNIDNLNSILLIQLDMLSDNILSSAFIRELRNNYSTAKIDIIIKSEYKEYFINCPYINSIITIDMNDNMDINQIIDFCKEKLWNDKYDLSINLSWDYNQTSALLSFLSFSTYRLSYRSNEYERYCSDLQYNKELYARQYYMDKFLYTHIIDNPFDMYSEKEKKLWILSLLNKEIKSNKLEIWFNDDDLNYAKQFIKNKKNIIIGIGGKDLNCHYPIKLFSEALNNINDDNHYIIVDKTDNLQDANNLTEQLKNKDVTNLANQLTLNQLSALISLSDLYIGNFYGIIHLVEALNKPMLLILKEANDKHNDHSGYLSLYHRYMPLSDNVHVLCPDYCIDECVEIPIFGGCVSDKAHCITQILPEEIVELYNKIM